MMPAKLLGLALLAAAWLLHRDVKKARTRGHLGPARRPVLRAERPWSFRLAIAVRVVGLAVCAIAAFLCLTGTRTEF